MRKLALLAGLAGAAVMALASQASAQSGAPYHAQAYVNPPYGSAIRGRSPNGDPIDRDGWRYRNGSWDNTCFRTLDYLDSMTACSGGGGGRR
jgi:hypothetical protein